MIYFINFIRFIFSLCNIPAISLISNDNRCSICLDILNKNKNIAITDCNHSFCLSCIIKHLNNDNKCPLCRNEIIDNDNCTNDSYNRITDTIACEKINELIESYDISIHTRAIRLFNNPNIYLKSLLQMYMFIISNKLIEYQINESISDYDEYDNNYDSIDSNEL